MVNPNMSILLLFFTAVLAGTAIVEHEAEITFNSPNFEIEVIRGYANITYETPDPVICTNASYCILHRGCDTSLVVAKIVPITSNAIISYMGSTSCISDIIGGVIGVLMLLTFAGIVALYAASCYVYVLRE